MKVLPPSLETRHKHRYHSGPPSDGAPCLSEDRKWSSSRCEVAGHPTWLRCCGPEELQRRDIPHRRYTPVQGWKPFNSKKTKRSTTIIERPTPEVPNIRANELRCQRHGTSIVRRRLGESICWRPLSGEGASRSKSLRRKEMERGEVRGRGVGRTGSS